MSNIKSKQGSSKKKTIVIVSSVLVVLIGLGAGLGVAFGSKSETSEDVKENNNNGLPFSAKSYWDAIKEEDPSDSNNIINILRINKEVTSKEDLEIAYMNIVSEGVNLTSFNELHLPYHLKNITEEKVKEVLHMDTFNNDNIGYILNKEDYDEGVATSGTELIGGYKNQKLVEINLPKDIDNLLAYTFYNNKIKKVNWSELIKLKSIGDSVFNNNKLTGNLDLSGLTALTSIGNDAFIKNFLSGTLTLPPNITTIGKRAFNSLYSSQNKIKGTLKLPKSLVSIANEAFTSNNIEELDWSEAKSLETIQQYAFANNKIKTLQFSISSPPKLNIIYYGAFQGNSGLNDSKEMFIDNFTLPKSLKTIGVAAIKIKKGITITVSSDATNINNNSFSGESPKIKRI